MTREADSRSIESGAASADEPARAGEAADPSARWMRFHHGRFTCTVVSDGPLLLGPATDSFPDAPPGEVDEIQQRLGLPVDRVELAQNLLVVETGRETILFDTGVGTMPDLGRRVYGPQSGQAVANLQAAGFEPADIDVVALTHAHPDHAWGLLDSNARPLFPRARILVGAADFEHFTDPAHAGQISNPRVRSQYTGAVTNLLPYGDRVLQIEDAYQVAEGVMALATPGHSPGHMAYEITNEGSTLLVWGDLCHHPILLERPHWNFLFDRDKDAARQQRLRIFQRSVDRDQTVLSYHFPFPGLGRLRRANEAFAWEDILPGH